MFHGTLPAIVTPFKKDESIDQESLRAMVQFLLDKGVDGIVPCGTTGESATLSHEEHLEVVRITIEEVHGRVPVLAGTGSNSTAESIYLTKAAKAAGADGALLISPYYNKPTQEGVYRHYKAIAEETAFPLVLYNVPGRTSLNMLPDTVARLARIDTIVGIKEASADLDQVSRIIEQCPDDFAVLSGDDFTVLPLLSVGGKGVISVVANAAPADMAEMVRAYRADNLARARSLHYRLLPLTRAMFLETNPIPVKTTLHLMGLCEETFRLPLCPMAPGSREQLVSALKAYGLL